MRSQECTESFTCRGVTHIHLNSAWHLKDNLIFKFVISCPISRTVSSKALTVEITALIAITASATVSTVALSKEVHTALFVDQLSKNVSVALTTQELLDRKIENKVNALEEAVLLIGQEIINLKIKLSLRCHAEFKWMCVTPLQVNDSVHSWERIRNHILGVWNHSDFSIDISKLYQDIQSMKQVESDFSSQ